MNLSTIPAGKKIPDDIYVIIEIPSYSQPVKYEIEKKTNIVYVDRILNTPMFYPCNYGYINQTISNDNDPIDVLVPTPYPLITNSVIRCKPVGMLKMIDESGEDNKIIAVPHDTISKAYENINDINDVPLVLKEQIAHFFKYYKKLDNKKWTEIKTWENADTAKNEIFISFHRASSKTQ